MSSDLIETSRRKILKAAGVGAIGTAGLAVGPGTVSANCPCEGVTLGKIEQEQLPACGETTTVTLTLDGDLRIADDPDCQGDKDVDVIVTATDCKDGDDEVTCVDLKIVDDNCACKCADDGLYFHGARVKGGPTHAEYDCDDVDDANQKYSMISGACAPERVSGNRFGISHIDIEVCVFPNDIQTCGDCANNGGQGCDGEC